jgi:hypothetical protein
MVQDDVALTPDQKQKLLVGGGVGGFALLVVFLGRRAHASAPPPPQAGQPQRQAPGPHAPAPSHARPEHKRRRRHDETPGRGERGERGEYGRKRKEVELNNPDVSRSILSMNTSNCSRYLVPPPKHRRHHD